MRGAPVLVAQCVKHLPADLVVPDSSPALEEIFPNRKWGSIAYNLSLSSAHRSDMTEILLKRTLNRKSYIHLYIMLCFLWANLKKRPALILNRNNEETEK